MSIAAMVRNEAAIRSLCDRPTGNEVTDAFTALLLAHVQAYGRMTDVERDALHEWEAEHLGGMSTADWPVWDLLVPEEIMRHQVAMAAVAPTTPRPDVPSSARWEVWERDDFRCRACGVRRFLTIDHVVPLSRGGTNDIDNLQTLCKPCNSSKKDR